MLLLVVRSLSLRLVSGDERLLGRVQAQRSKNQVKDFQTRDHRVESQKTILFLVCFFIVETGEGE